LSFAALETNFSDVDFTTFTLVKVSCRFVFRTLKPIG
jgi:hypothetical protein